MSKKLHRSARVVRVKSIMNERERESERREIDSERRGSSSSEVAFFVRALKRNGEYFHAVFKILMKLKKLEISRF